MTAVLDPDLADGVRHLVRGCVPERTPRRNLSQFASRERSAARPIGDHGRSRGDRALALVAEAEQLELRSTRCEGRIVFG
jgi:hypothetical protein